MKWFMYCLICLSFGNNVLAEMRVWEDRKGNVLEAEFNAVVAGKVILHDPNGKEYKLPISGLCDKDQKYIQAILPPDVDIKFKKIQDRKSNSSTVVMHGEVELTKTSRMPHSSQLKATLFIIGEDSFEDEYILMDRTEHEFTFETKKKHSFSGEKFKMQQYRNSGSNDGVEYKGYLVMICDKSGKVLLIKSSSDAFTSNVDYLKPLKTGARFPDDMEDKPIRESSSSRHYF